ncbi:hypothetical protein Tco_1084344, partial [Tanacetum coccineum]
MWAVWPMIKIYVKLGVSYCGDGSMVVHDVDGDDVLPAIVVPLHGKLPLLKFLAQDEDHQQLLTKMMIWESCLLIYYLNNSQLFQFNVAKLRKLRPAFKDDGGSVTAGNSSSIKFRLQVRVKDESGTISLTRFNDEVQALVDGSAYQLCDKCEKAFEVIVPDKATMEHTIIPSIEAKNRKGINGAQTFCELQYRLLFFTAILMILLSHIDHLTLDNARSKLKSNVLVIEKACAGLVPNFVCDYLCDLSKLFTSYYSKVWPGKEPILGMCKAAEVGFSQVEILSSERRGPCRELTET